MKTLTLLVASAFLTLRVFAQDSADSYDAETFFDTISFSGASFSADESRILLSSDETGVFSVYAQSVEEPKRLCLRESEGEACFAVSYFPGDDRFLYTADQGGNELNHVFVVDTAGTVIDLTPGENLKAMFAGFAHDESGFWIATNERDPQFFDIYLYEHPEGGEGHDFEDYRRTLIYENTEGFSLGSISRDGRWLALAKANNNADSDIYLVDLESEEKKAVLITEHEGFIQHQPASFTPDGKSLLYLTDRDNEFQRVFAYDLVSGENEPYLSADWDIEFVSYSWSGRFRIHGVNADAKSVITIMDLESDDELELPELPSGELRNLSVSKSDDLMAFYINRDTSPSNLYVYDLDNGELRKLTRALNPKIDEAHLVSSKTIRYESYDDLEIPCLLYKPHGASAESKAPAMLWIHGGPGGQSRQGYNPFIQHLVNQGYAILAVNNRGSSGYGKTFFHLDDQKHGDADLRDCVEAKAYLESLEWIDQDRIGIMGGSYGGYMVVAALAFRPEVFDVGIDIFGVTNWLRTLESIPPWWASFRDSLYAEMGDPDTDRERLQAISPLFHAERISKPMLVIQGANDPRVLKVESDEIVDAVKENGVPVEYVVFPDEGHGFNHKKNRIAAAEAFARFLAEHLRTTN